MERHNEVYDVIVIGGGQSALATGYFLRRSELKYLLLDSNSEGGGAWQHTWDSLHLFSPAQWSSLPGVLMPGGQSHYPTKSATITYLKNYESRYSLPIIRPVTVHSVAKNDDLFEVRTSNGVYLAKVVISATGTYANPFIPDISGIKSFKGTLLHAADYRSPDLFSGKRIAIVGEGNSGAQILAEVSKVASTIWITRQEPAFLPDEIDGRYLFDAATQQYEAKKQGKEYHPPSLGHIVMVPSVKEARERGVYQTSLRSFDSFSEISLHWKDGRSENVAGVIFCTGYRPALQHLHALGIIQPDGKVKTAGTRAIDVAGLWLVGYGNWTGFASATLIGVGRTARTTVEEVKAYLEN